MYWCRLRIKLSSESLYDLCARQTAPTEIRNPSDSSVLTFRLVGEEVVVLGDIGDDAEPVRHFHGHHVLWVQQSWNTQLCLGHLKRLRGKNRKRKGG